MTKAVISAFKRSPFTPAVKGELVRVRPDDLAAQTISGLVEAAGVDPELIEDIILGCAFPEGEQGLNMARMLVFLAQLPKTIAGVTVNRFCGSSMQAIHQAAGMIAAGAGEAFICGGVESMTRVPMGGHNPLFHSELFENYPEAYISMGNTAENLAKRYEIDRANQERYALLSQKRAAKARETHALVEEIIPIIDGERTIEHDGCIRPDTTLEGLAGLAPAFDQTGSVTAGTSSPLTDGASAVLVVSEAFADKHNLPKLARIKSMAVAGCLPEIMGIGPVAATKKALERAGLSIADLDLIELNEAFAVQALACIQELGLDEEKVNVEGGALAIGHPLGASGARITGKAAVLLSRNTSSKYALATMCIGGGQGIATILEAI